MSDFDDAMAFYDRNYDLIGQWFLVDDQQIVLGDPARPKCRFCGREPPEAKFKDEAHAIPELLGNRTLFTAEECDDCNHFFGEGIENQLGNWSKPARTFSRIRGKSGIPKLKSGADGVWRIEPTEIGLEVKGDEKVIVREDGAGKTLTFLLRRDTYVPADVLKAFVKIGLILLPAEELPNFQAALAWLRPRDDLQPVLVLDAFPVLHSFLPGSWIGGIVAFILRRKAGVEDVPYAFLVLGYGNDVFQVPLPTPERDAQLLGRAVSLFHFPFPVAKVDPALAYRVGAPRYSRLDLIGFEPIRGESAKVVLGFESSQPSRRM